MAITFKPHMGEFTILKGPPPSEQPLDCPADPADSKNSSVQQQVCYKSIAFAYGANTSPKTYKSTEKKEFEAFYDKESNFYTDQNNSSSIYDSYDRYPPFLSADTPLTYPTSVALEKYLSWFTAKSWSCSLSYYYYNKEEGDGSTKETYESAGVDGSVEVGKSEDRPRPRPDPNDPEVSFGWEEDKVVWSAGAHCRSSEAPPLILGQMDKIAEEIDENAEFAGAPNARRIVTRSDDGQRTSRPGPIAFHFYSTLDVTIVTTNPNGGNAINYKTILDASAIILPRFFISEDRKTCYPFIYAAYGTYSPDQLSQQAGPWDITNWSTIPCNYTLYPDRRSQGEIKPKGYLKIDGIRIPMYRCGAQGGTSSGFFEITLDPAGASGGVESYG